MKDILSDVLNEIMNAKKANRTQLVTTKHSKLLLKVLDIMKQYNYIDYELKDELLKITFGEVTECKGIKPRYTVAKKDIEKYVRRFLPARDFGFVIISTSKGLMNQHEAKENKIGGSLIAYFY